MTLAIERVLSFFTANFPPWPAILIGGPLALLWSYVSLRGAGYMKVRRGYPTGYTRKIFHFLIFSTVVAIQWIWGTPIVCLFGGMCTVVIFYAVWRGPGHLLYEAMAREKDEPHRTYYIVVPYFATLIGGLASNILFGSVAVVGYLVTGVGDAVGEPVGTRFGRHTYRVPARASVGAIRSLEGSAAVLLVSIVAVAAAMWISPDLRFTQRSLAMVPLIGLVSAGLEAVSPHGWDNTTMQVVPSLLAWWIL